MTNIIELTDARSGATAQLMPEAGFNCFSLRIPVEGEIADVLDRVPGFETTGERPTRSGIPLLFPYPNRIRAKQFTWDERRFDLSGAHHDPEGNAIHGLVVDRPWRIVSQSTSHVTGRFQLSVDAPDRRGLWPADFTIDVRYELFAQALRCDVRVFNPDRVPLPWGFGTHSYFRVPISPASRRDDCLVQVPAARSWELKESLPTGRQLPVAGANDLREGSALAGLKLDDVLTGLSVVDDRIACVVMDPQAGWQVTQVTDPQFRELVAFTPPHGRSVCLEPYTCVTDAINLHAAGVDSGLQVLPPGQESRFWFEIHAGPVLA